uniref:Uncharacterized protein n=1 Tax=Anguilla anguilla TaxID=7936 RepID=A0A0E9TUG4_ANGAN
MWGGISWRFLPLYISTISSE